ncbi:30S ribosomal protein S7 [bacterium]|nr:30S ribosomal protein S7 [bacterium]NUN46277.1 30S ribosomal protein S7 [bacterium]HMV25556.1 30S ribosomal protein S7 [bacterium]HMW32996.1 30S ribosomal protein S7 [bacterium]HMW36833.1 30S ribosomal protein S7 [bacterium]
MSRRKRSPKRRIPADPKFNSVLVTKMINVIMWQGKRGVAESILYDAMETVEKKTGKNGLEILEKAIKNVAPLLEVRSRRVGGANYQVPVEVRAERRQTLALRWLIGYSRERAGKSMASKLADEILAASNNEGAAVKKREDVHKMAEANKAFAHFRW